MNFSELQPRFIRALAGFTMSSNFPVLSQKSTLDRDRFPVPELLLILLRDVMGFKWSGRGDKVRWTVWFDVNGRACAVELGKRGTYLYYSQDLQSSLPRVLGQLEAALGKLEKAMEVYAKEQVRAGNLTIANRSSEFYERYQFFRRKAQAAYEATERPPRRRKGAETSVDRLGSILMQAWNAKVQKEGEAFYYSVAMIDAYFSWLEHQLILLRAFLGTPLTNTTVTDVISARWSDKLKFVLGDDIAPQQHIIAAMRRLKEQIRNPFAHGGVQNDSGSMYFRVPNVGALPANMSRTRYSTHFNFIPVSAPDHTKTCELFDSLEKVLRTGRLEWPAEMIAACVDPAWDRATLDEYRGLTTQSAERKADWLRNWADEWERHQNMDY